MAKKKHSRRTHYNENGAVGTALAIGGFALVGFVAWAVWRSAKTVKEEIKKVGTSGFGTSGFGADALVPAVTRPIYHLETPRGDVPPVRRAIYTAPRPRDIAPPVQMSIYTTGRQWPHPVSNRTVLAVPRSIYRTR